MSIAWRDPAKVGAFGRDHGATIDAGGVRDRHADRSQSLGDVRRAAELRKVHIHDLPVDHPAGHPGRVTKADATVAHKLSQADLAEGRSPVPCDPQVNAGDGRAGECGPVPPLRFAERLRHGVRAHRNAPS
jgi:hypothetical protein